MAAVTTIIAGAALATSALSAVEQQKQAKRSAKAQEKIRNEERAQNVSRQLAERRQQIREERIKRARVLQSAENTGTAFSSGESGALSSLGTQLGSNLGFNQSMIRSGERISTFAQESANAQARGQSAALLGNLALSAAPVAGSIFGGGSVPGTTPQPAQSYDANNISLFSLRN